MQDHYEENAAGYEAVLSKGFTTLRSHSYSAAVQESARNFRQPVDEKHLVRGMLFSGFRKCLYAAQKFDSDTERRFSVVLENDDNVLKWVKPGREDFQIHYHHDEAYEPDFVVETKTVKSQWINLCIAGTPSDGFWKFGMCGKILASLC